MAIDDRPRKKKKKKSNIGLWIGLGVGAAVLLLLLIGTIATIAIIMANSGAPQAKAQPKPEPAVEKPAPPVMPPPEKKGAGGIGRSMEVSEVRNILKQLGLAYHSCESAENRAPNNRKELSSYYENNARINEVLDKGDIVFLYGVRIRQMPEGTSNTILAYEKIQDQHGNRIVLMADGTVATIDEATFQKAPKAGKAK